MSDDPSKRPREEGDGEQPAKRVCADPQDLVPDASAAADAPSRVVHVRGVRNDTSEADMYSAFGGYGKVTQVLVLHNLGQALVEFEDPMSVHAVVSQPGHMVMGQQVTCQISSSRTITKKAQHSQPAQPGPVVLLTVANPTYPITLESIHQLCSYAGKVVRIVMLRKKRVQALVEFEHDSMAAKAMEILQGHDLFPGCCTIKVEYSTAQNLTVRQNSVDMRDFTTPGAYEVQSPAMHPALMNMGGGAAGGGPMPGSVVLVSKAPTEHLNCQSLFNLVCLYGNVDKIKFITTKPGMVLIQMSEPAAANNVVAALHGVTIFGNQVDFIISKHPEIKESNRSENLADGSPTSVTYTGNSMNRFRHANSKAQASAPSTTLFYFNAPPHYTEEHVRALLLQKYTSNPVAIRVLAPNESGKSSRGLIKFNSVPEAVDCLIKVNHTQIEDPNVFTFKLTFSSNQL